MRPSPSWPRLCTGTIPGCSNCASTCASWRRRASRLLPDTGAWEILIATSRPSGSSRAANTRPMPPAPIGRIDVYLPWSKSGQVATSRRWVMTALERNNLALRYLDAKQLSSLLAVFLVGTDQRTEVHECDLAKSSARGVQVVRHGRHRHAHGGGHLRVRSVLTVRQVVPLEGLEGARFALARQGFAQLVHGTREERADGFVTEEPVEVAQIRGDQRQFLLGSWKIEGQDLRIAAPLQRRLGLSLVLKESIETGPKERTEP